jgi:peptide/nickel transport system substrate-binding protein
VHNPVCHSLVNPLLDVQSYLPSSISSENFGYFEDPDEVTLYQKMLHETDPAAQHALMTQFQKLVMDTEAHSAMVLWWNRIIPYRAYVKGFKVSPSHYINQDLATIWLDK